MPKCVTKDFDESFFQFVLIDYYILFSFFFDVDFLSTLSSFSSKSNTKKDKTTPRDNRVLRDADDAERKKESEQHQPRGDFADHSAAHQKTLSSAKTHSPEERRTFLFLRVVECLLPLDREAAQRLRLLVVVFAFG